MKKLGEKQQVSLRDFYPDADSISSHSLTNSTSHITNSAAATATGNDYLSRRQDPKILQQAFLQSYSGQKSGGSNNPVTLPLMSDVPYATREPLAPPGGDYPPSLLKQVDKHHAMVRRALAKQAKLDVMKKREQQQQPVLTVQSMDSTTTTIVPPAPESQSSLPIEEDKEASLSSSESSSGSSESGGASSSSSSSSSGVQGGDDDDFDIHALARHKEADDNDGGGDGEEEDDDDNDDDDDDDVEDSDSHESGGDDHHPEGENPPLATSNLIIPLPEEELFEQMADAFMELLTGGKKPEQTRRVNVLQQQQSSSSSKATKKRQGSDIEKDLNDLSKLPPSVDAMDVEQKSQGDDEVEVIEEETGRLPSIRRIKIDAAADSTFRTALEHLHHIVLAPSPPQLIPGHTAQLLTRGKSQAKTLGEAMRRWLSDPTYDQLLSRHKS